MKILVDGKLDNLRIIKFKCHRCGCVFIANEMEYCVIGIDNSGNGRHIFMCECPFCGFNTKADEVLRY